MPDAFTALTEAAVGAACIAIAWVARHRPRLRWLTAGAAVAGVAAIGHAGWSMASG